MIHNHYNDVIMGAIASQITSLASVYSIVYSDAVQRKHQSSASLAFVRGFHRGPVNSPHKWPVTRKLFPFDDVIMMKLDHIYLYAFWLFQTLWHFDHLLLCQSIKIVHNRRQKHNLKNYHTLRTSYIQHMLCGDHKSAESDTEYYKNIHTV